MASHPTTKNTSGLYRSLVALRRSFFLSLAVFGVILLILGFVFDVVFPMFGYLGLAGTIAGMFGIWGATALLIGCGTYATLRYLRAY